MSQRRRARLNSARSLSLISPMAMRAMNLAFGVICPVAVAIWRFTH
jgi:hypothetical protein